MKRPLFTTWHEDLPVRALLDQIGHYDASVYRRDIERRGLDAVVEEEWEQMQDSRSGWAKTAEEAAAHVSAINGWHVVEVTPEALRTALVEWLGLDRGKE